MGIPGESRNQTLGTFNHIKWTHPAKRVHTAGTSMWNEISKLESKTAKNLN